jgi:type I restriction enzyme, S subunit
VPIISSSGISGHHSTPMVDPPGVVTGRYGTIGEVFFIGAPFWPLNTALYVRDFKGNSPRFVYYVLREIDFQRYSDKAAVPGVNRNHLHEAPVSIPPKLVQKEFERLLAPLWIRQGANSTETIALVSLRDTLLPKLISGELRVKEAEKLVEAAL